MKLEKIALIISIITGVIGSIIGIYSLYKPSADLKAYVTDSIFYTPPQYDKLMRKTIEDSDYTKVFSLVNSISENANFEDKSKVVESIIQSIRIPFSSVFPEGIEEYKRLVFIGLHNNGNATAKDVYIDFPGKVLTMAMDDKNDTIDKSDLISRFLIPSIRQDGTYRIWAWAKNNEFKKENIRIGTDNEVTKIEYGEVHYGMASYVATIYEEHTRLFIAIVIALIFITCMTISYLFFFLICQLLKSTEKTNP